MQTCFESEHYPRYFDGKDTHDSSNRFVAQIIAYTKDRDFIEQLILSGLPENYNGNSLRELNGSIKGALENGYDERNNDDNKNASKSDILLRMLDCEDVEFFHDEYDRGYISIGRDGKGRQNLPLNSSAAQSWFKGLFYKKKGRVISSQACKDAVEVLIARAIHDCKQKSVFLRVAPHEKSLIVNLADDDGNVVVIDKNGYRITKDSPVVFIKSSGMGALPEPKSGGDLREFKKLLGLSDINFCRVLAFIIGCLKPDGPYLFLLVEGEQGSGKSFLCLLLKMLIDPSNAAKLRMPDSERDLMIHAKQNHLLLFDNLSGMKGDLSDALCSLSTGGGFATRKLYTDDEQQIFNESRPYILNGITSIATRPDLLERSVSINLPAMPENQRKTEGEILRQFYELRPKILGKLFDIVACAIRRFDEVKTPTTIRMADAAKWLIAAEPETGFAEGVILHALESSQNDAMIERMANDSLSEALIRVITDGPYNGTIGLLYERLKQTNPTYDRFFPSSPSHLSKTLARMRPAFNKIGIKIEFGTKTRNGKNIFVWLEEVGSYEDAQKLWKEQYDKILY